MTDLVAALRGLRIVPVIVVDAPEQALPLRTALIEGGLPCAEITFRTPAAEEALARMAGAGDDLLLGAGTVLSTGQVERARAAGARFVVSPGFNPRVVDHCLERGIPVFPGVATPTEIEAALEKGLRVLKFFPAEPLGGVRYLKAIAAPFGDVVFIPTGGVDASNLADYLAFDRVLACGGSWMAPRAWIRAGAFDRVREEVAGAVAIVRDHARHAGHADHAEGG
jgi:2-dehydro-3-deoxyphosphogluconate aldolase/(4S)-4-hydroxy-2-oxoglutarate aldolase